MKLWSRGLGRRSLTMDFRYYTVRSENGGIVISGVTQAPVAWEFRIDIEPDDLEGLAQVAARRPTRRYLVSNWKRLLRYIFSRTSEVQLEQGLEDRVERAYEQVMNGSKARRRRLPPRANQQTASTTDASQIADAAGVEGG